MPRCIHILPDSVANQIAAGEVVERPASVVKELVENALDAGATAIQILVEAGGKQRIRVSDNGSGMGREDALLSLDRHATSKIVAAEDLSGIGTFGFRGEALPSIAAVSRLSLETREVEEEVGTSIRAEGGRIVSVRDFPRRPGTTVEARNLFFNAPARRKFLKSASAETRAVSEGLVGLALANPHVAFSLSSGTRVLLDLEPVADVAERVSALWGRESAQTLIPVAGRGDRLLLQGLIQRPDAAQPGFRRVYLFVGNRPIRNPGLVRAADRGYRTTTSVGQRPWLILFLQPEGGSVDVNVHPAKHEVRFQDPGAAEALVEESVRDALAGGMSSARFDSSGGPSEDRVRESSPPGWERSEPRAPEEKGRESRESQMAFFLAGSPNSEDSGPGDEAREAGETDLMGQGSPGPGGEAARPRLWQAHNTYLFAETREGLLIIDQHSAHERVLFQRLMAAFGRDGQESQRLLFPLTIRLSPSELTVVEELGGLLARAGFEVEAFGGDTVLVQSVPNPHPYFDAQRCFREMVAELAEGSELVRSAKNQHERIAMTFACKGAIKAGQRLSEAEMGELFDALFATDLPFHDVHGRPTIVRLSKSELERKFGRDR
jgi:DNA mismatch repair protein MutL